MDTKSGNCSEKCENNDKVGHRMTSSSTNSENCPGCGLGDLDKITITVAPTTGGRFDISVQKNIAVENLKKVISKKLKVPKERILLLHKERQLRDGSLQQNSIYHGSTLTLLPSVETGLLSQRPEQGVMQALESLNDSQVNDFLSGKAPLNLTMRLGDHMMLIQLQLSSVTPSMTRKTSSNVSLQQNPKANDSYLTKQNVPNSSEGASTGSGCTSSSGGSSSNSSSSSSSSSNSGDISGCGSSTDSNISLPDLTFLKSKLNTLLNKNNENLNALKRKFYSGEEESSALKRSKMDDESKSRYFKDLNLKNVLLNVSDGSGSSDGKSARYSDMMRESTGEPPKKSHHHHHHHHHHSSHHHPHHHHHHHHHHHQSSRDELQAKKTEILSQIMESVRKISENAAEAQSGEPKPCDKDVVSVSYGSKCNVNCTCSNKGEYGGLDGGAKSGESAALDTKALAEASRNLTQTLKQLSSEVLTCRSENLDDCSSSSSSTARRRPGTQGAIIESMQHHGKGVFSGTFSGTLNPALQDRFGRPKRDISTIIHILNDLLCATPQYRRQRQPQPQIKVQTHETSSNSDTTSSTELVSVENEATRGKLERLRMVMKQNRARRRARREAKTSDNASNGMSNVDELETNNQENSELMEISPPEPVMA